MQNRIETTSYRDGSRRTLGGLRQNFEGFALFLFHGNFGGMMFWLFDFGCMNRTCHEVSNPSSSSVSKK